MSTKAQGKAISLQHRDISLIRILAEDFRILNGEQIGELFHLGSIRRRNFRLKQLCDAGYLSSRELIGWAMSQSTGITSARGHRNSFQIRPSSGSSRESEHRWRNLRRRVWPTECWWTRFTSGF